MLKISRFLAVAALAVLAGCVTVPVNRVVYDDAPLDDQRPSETYPERFTVEEGRAPNVVALFRESPAPRDVRVSEGYDFIRDRTELAREGYVLVGRSLFDTTDPDARSRAAERAVAIGAERAVFYPVDPTASNRDQRAGG
ncbi:MAG: hypothetical protein ABIR16_08315, partial [Dokdonella sp.]